MTVVWLEREAYDFRHFELHVLPLKVLGLTDTVHSRSLVITVVEGTCIISSICREQLAVPRSSALVVRTMLISP